ncbi:MAG: hypothetical protein A2X10_14400 [Bacteroidetes bacterium GWA2_33_15]|nr:MAG: hypothetical protein A2X10_14400 [Bacteroidetes bacterium GWA2_33_15]
MTGKTFFVCPLFAAFSYNFKLDLTGFSLLDMPLKKISCFFLVYIKLFLYLQTGTSVRKCN